MSVVAKAFGCDSRDVGYAGMKDKAAVTRQWISVPAHLEEPPATSIMNG